MFELKYLVGNANHSVLRSTMDLCVNNIKDIVRKIKGSITATLKHKANRGLFKADITGH